MPTRPVDSLKEGLFFLVAIPIVGILMGGIFSFLAMKATRERDPWLSAVLAIALAITVFGLGMLLQAPLVHLLAVWVLSLLLLLLARAGYGSLGHNLERFGVVHAIALLATLLVALAGRVHVRSHSPVHPVIPRKNGADAQNRPTPIEIARSCLLG